MAFGPTTRGRGNRVKDIEAHEVKGGSRPDDRGRMAGKPSEIPKRGWWDILLRVKDEASADNLGIIAAGVAFQALFALFPMLAAIISIYGLVADPASVESQLQSLGGLLPAEAQGILAEQLKSLTSTSSAGLSFGLALSVLLALWGATRGVKAVMDSLNIVYDEPEKRGFFRYNLTALAITTGAVLFAILALILVAIAPAVLNFLGLTGSWVSLLIKGLRWPVLGLIALIGLAAIYRYAPSRAEPQWKWVSWGAVMAVALWLVGSALFSWYVSSFGDFNKTYGSVGAVIILLTWFYLSAYIVLIGAELNAEMEHQTARDTTTGPEEPMGRRQARMADTVAEPKPKK